jgi:guanylate kinase
MGVSSSNIITSRKKGRVFVISAPSGCGKTTLTSRLSPSLGVVRSISFTTRPARPGERSGSDYHFISKEDFKKLIQKKEMLEWACVFGNYYGTQEGFVERQVRKGKDVLLVIDVQGAMQVKKSGYDATLIFLLPPSLSALRERLGKRNQDSKGDVINRMKKSRHEMSYVKKYDYVVVNDKMDKALCQIESIITAERCRVR